MIDFWVYTQCLPVKCHWRQAFHSFILTAPLLNTFEEHLNTKLLGKAAGLLLANESSLSYLFTYMIWEPFDEDPLLKNSFERWLLYLQ